MNIDLSVLIASKGVEVGTEGSGSGVRAGETETGIGASNGAGFTVGSVGGYIHGELIDA